jgi:hypothetical protein
MAMRIKVAVFWFVTPCSDVITFGGPCCHHLQGDVFEAERSSEKMVSYHITAGGHKAEDPGLKGGGIDGSIILKWILKNRI